jgi:hypothetical protein
MVDPKVEFFAKDRVELMRSTARIQSTGYCVCS